jgi:hypothetical protein
VPLLGHFAALQVRDSVADLGREVLFEGVGRGPDVRIAVVDSVAVSHEEPPSLVSRADGTRNVYQIFSSASPCMPSL